ncbi:hypothetical protein AB3K25_05310 [Leuconostoc sp. MS02]|uniref:DNA-directed RNA polymerase beta subunit n=1 Tax=Leuconostoc aquikimchii TaxID=3236804 RepID=A0ABV3S3N7_9LACO
MTNNRDFSRIVNNYFKNDYRERGKMKWQGFFLSDHTSSLKKDDNQRITVTKKLPRIPLSEVQNMLRSAAENYKKVTVQQNIKDLEGHMVPNVSGVVMGFSDNGVYINQKYIAFQNIRTVVEKS